jgi:hypothetical protein
MSLVPFSVWILRSILSIMHPFQSQQYQALPVEEKQEIEEGLDIPVDKPRRRKIIIAFCVALSSLVAVLLLLGVTALWTSSKSTSKSLPVESPTKFPDSLLEHEIRAPGDRYLLGVGKADITG